MLNATSSEPIHLNVSVFHLNVSFEWFIIPFKPVEKFTITNFWKVALSEIPYFREELKDIS